MKRTYPAHRCLVALAFLLAASLGSPAATFTTATRLDSGNTNYDGADIVVSNCVLTVDGPHTFASLTVQNGGQVTHSFAANGFVSQAAAVVAEPHVLSQTNADPLSCANAVAAGMVVQDLLASVTYTNGVDYQVLTNGDGTLALQLVPGSSIAEGSTNLVSYTCGITVASGLTLTITGDARIQTGGAINADFKGYGGATGPGRGFSTGSPGSGSGGGHGGYGGPSADGAAAGAGYETLAQPTDKGSGGGNGYVWHGGNGGGAIRLTVGGLLLNDGVISANGAAGTNARSGGGSGGSIWLSAGILAGAGRLQANGGDGEPSRGGGGGGGRIALWYGTNFFSGTASAWGGQGYSGGGAGTLYSRLISSGATALVVDNGGHPGRTPLSNSEQGYDLSVRNGATVSPSENQAFGNLQLTSNAWVAVASGGTLTVSGNATVDSGCGFNADGAGNLPNSGTGAGHVFYGGPSTYGSGGSHGGNGGMGSGTYDSLMSPTSAGSGGGSYYGIGSGSSGGGALHLSVAGTLVLNGTLSASGAAGLGDGNGGGAGGSVWVTAGILAGAGRIAADGGDGNGSGLYAGGGGGGGRIAVLPGVNLFFGSFSARGGEGQVAGGAGTIYTKAGSQSVGMVLIDNGGQNGAATTWSSTSTFDLTAQAGAVVYVPQGQTVGNLFLNANGWIITSNQQFTITGGATIQPGAGILANGSSALSGSYGTGGYDAYSKTSGGGGYGGRGGQSVSNALGGTSFGYIMTPTDMGAPGGGYNYIGGAGGGSIRLTVTGALTVDGTISANGVAATASSGGGGSGGTVALTVGSLTGAGTISANGGSGQDWNGGGSGGRIAIQAGANSFSGQLTAAGGPGFQAGGAGTIYTKLSSQSSGLVVADNNGLPGSTTPITSINSQDLAVRNGAVGLLTYASLTLGNLWVGSNAWLLVSNYNGSSYSVTITGSATVLAGGGISADGFGATYGTGTGGSYNAGPIIGYVGGGGGYGGNGGGANYAPGLGGAAFYNGYSTAQAGASGGGTSAGGGGPGGGALTLSVTGTLLVDGKLSANGRSPTNANFGAGSGGGIGLTVGTLAGTGAITADGGSVIGNGGGGGGGRIFINYTANTFTGRLSAYGGAGYAYGGAGTVSLQRSGQQSISQVVVDNAGQTGGSTPYLLSGTPDLTLRNGAMMGINGSQTANSLLLVSNAWLTYSNGSSYGTLTVNGSATIGVGCGILATTSGSQSSGSSGGSVSSNNVSYGGGGGYGGYGGMGAGGAAGGYSFGSATSPSSSYSLNGKGGGDGGGVGGGYLSLAFKTGLLLDGRISADGGSAALASGGGGAGGSLVVTVGTLSGSGLISADGGDGGDLGGGGGGGRISLQYSVNQFSGGISAVGGQGYRNGGAGTVYTFGTSSRNGQVLVDNGGQTGAATLLGSSSSVDLIIRRGALLTATNTQTLNTLLVGSNGWINGQTINLTIVDSATIEAGGGLLADGTGYASGQGAGGYVSTQNYGYIGGGGGHGGQGAAAILSNSIATGGAAFDSVFTPSLPGGPGGSNGSYGGAGGGYIRLSVANGLIVDGRLSANGLPGVRPGAGGGAGGSIYLSAKNLAGGGLISANGGSGNGLGGGGGGGRIALQYTTLGFAGGTTAYGGAGGGGFGGAGTIYTKLTSQSTGQVAVDNGGPQGTNTPFAATWPPVSLSVLRGGVVVPSGSPLWLSNLVVGSNSLLACPSLTTDQEVAVYGNATIQPGGRFTLDGKGFTVGNGPGAGVHLNYGGSGAGYGGAGGASFDSAGGPTYGSLQQPQNPGSGGGLGFYGTGGGLGGGALYLRVGGLLQLDGQLSANGGDDPLSGGGGGSGGSLWVCANYFLGGGVLAADGGEGDPWLGGGGGGGRVAIDSPHNFFSGAVSVAAGNGFSRGQDGTVFITNALPPFVALSSSLGGAVTNTISSVDLSFSQEFKAQSELLSDFILNTPIGPLSQSSISYSTISPTLLRVSFPTQTAEGAYSFSFGTNLQSLLGVPMSQLFTGAFSIVWPVISGNVIDTNNQPVGAVVLQPDGGLSPTTTGANGAFSLKVTPGVSVTVTPSLAGRILVPSFRAYSAVTANLSNQVFVAATSITPNLSSIRQSTNVLLHCFGISGLTYQVNISTNLIDWTPDVSLAGTNGPLEFVMPIDSSPQRFFRLGTQY